MDRRLERVHHQQGALGDMKIRVVVLDHEDGNRPRRGQAVALRLDQVERVEALAYRRKSTDVRNLHGRSPAMCCFSPNATALPPEDAERLLPANRSISKLTNC